LKVSIVVRCRDEEDWIGHCLAGVFAQDVKDPEVVIVDNGSIDRTLDIAARFPIARILTVSEYFPGAALNRGVEATSGDTVVFLSAHCVPKDSGWLGALVGGLQGDVVGVYGRQLPVTFSEPSDFRDLIVTFGPEPRVQTVDSFFHNANSAVRRSAWDQLPFDETVTNIEDRLWARQIQGRGFKIAYEPRAAVFHYHGIHHNQSRSRAESTLEVLKSVESFEQQAYMPESLLPARRDIVAVVPTLQSPGLIGGTDPLANLLAQLTACPYIKDTFVVSNDETVLDASRRARTTAMRRPPELATTDAGLGEVLQWVVGELAAAHRYPDYVVYANPEYVLRPPRIIDALIEDVCYKGLDTVFVGYPEYQNFWRYSPSGVYEEVGEELLPRRDKHPMFKSLLGLGTVTRARIARLGRLVSDRRVGVMATHDLRHTLRASDETQRALIEMIVAEENRLASRTRVR